MTSTERNSGGFALIAVLWIVVIAAVLTTAAMIVASDLLATVRNRSELVRATWRGEECLALARAAIAGILGDALRAGRYSHAWHYLDELTTSTALIRSSLCTMHFTASGAVLNVNEVDRPTLRRLFIELGIPAARSDSMADALLDWRETNDSLRPLDAGTRWYRAAGELPPHDGPIAAIEELAHIHGFDSVGDLSTYLGTEPARVCLSHAPRQVLASLPGMTPELLYQILSARERRDFPLSFSALLDRVSINDMATAEGYRHLAGQVSTTPDTWLLSIASHSGSPSVGVRIEAWLERSNQGVNVVRTRYSIM